MGHITDCCPQPLALGETLTRRAGSRTRAAPVLGGEAAKQSAEEVGAGASGGKGTRPPRAPRQPVL